MKRPTRDQSVSTLLPLLAIEYSQRSASVALLYQGSSRAAIDPSGESTASNRSAADLLVIEEPCLGDWRSEDILLPAIARVLAARSERIGCVAVSAGPGGFTGLRMSIAAAKGLAQGMNIPTVAVPSALVVAHAVSSAGLGDAGADGVRALDIALAAKRDSFWLTRLERASSGWSIRWQGLCDAAGYVPSENALLVADEHLDPAATALATERGIRRIQPRWCAASCGFAALDLVAGEHRDAHYGDAQGLQPLYPREPEAVTLWRARAAKP